MLRQRTAAGYWNANPVPCAWSSVNAGERAVMFNRLVGVKDVVIGEGTHFRVPWFDRPIVYDVRTRPHTIKSLTGSKGT
mgnify:CR=1 FL=1